jgi:hypothetical protein
VGDEAHLGSKDLSHQGAAPSRGAIGWLRIGMGLALRLLCVRRVQSRVRADSVELTEQALGAPLWNRRTHLQDAEDGKKDS